MTPVLGICLSLAALHGGAVVFVPAEHFTLAWTHSIEKLRWEEDYRVHQGSPGELRLEAGEARIQGSAAGMEPPEDARWRDGWFVYQPATRSPQALRLTRSAFTADYDLCIDGHCRSLGRLLPSDGGVTLLRPCTGTP